MYDVVAMGELLIDFTLDRTQEDGYPVMAAHPGGAVANFLAPLAKYGRKTALIAKVGQDALGRLLIDTVTKAGIDPGGICETPEAFTTLAFVTRDSQGERVFSFARKPGADVLLRAGEVDRSLLEAAKVVHFGSVGMTDEPARSAHRELIPLARQAGKWISYDPNLREPLWKDLGQAREQILWGLGQADIIKISDSEIEFLYGLSPEDGADRLFRDFSPKLVYVTLGKDGCYFRNPRARGYVPGLRGLQVIDTTGAGDIFGGAAMYGLLKTGLPPEELDEAALRRIVTFACTAASLSTTRLGGISSVPTLEAVAAAMQ